MDIARIFKHGGSQAVRLPKDFRFDTPEVRIRRHGAAVILEPVPQDWAWLAPLIGPLDDDFAAAAREAATAQDRPGLDVFE
ncbi:antitoxin [Paraburkholderia acidisoli]|uniref:AbrB/MazE/SpoVT family DNA-binding domain-containing protein n=1 Tax=Paraburkholderia acidisoli TaxID=2571748 RepID=A0A7Z2GF16_9BURK|nr:type II toxin-antitoxin system VapB family antitoxin [Paraburkholderia acidisoli]QGZ60612.1 AbrB/MazE/SpoVT family DNA-binding domain-containing protein [Paraburkholderia acidisoli]